MNPMIRPYNESWISRWIRRTGNTPKDIATIKTCKHVTASAFNLCPTIHDAALTPESQKFKHPRRFRPDRLKHFLDGETK